MSRQISVPDGAEQWLINIIELYNRSDVTLKQIAEKENLAEKSVSNVLLGKSKNPGVDLIRRIIHAIGGSWAEIFGESGAVIGGRDLVSLQSDLATLTHDLDVYKTNCNMLDLENSVLKDKVVALENENKLLRLKLEYEEKLNAVHNFYNKLNTNN